jgi:hypothetical protein
LDKELEKWIEKADDYKLKHGEEMVVYRNNGILFDWSAEVFDRYHKNDPAYVVLYRTDGKMKEQEDVPMMTVSEYAASSYERSCRE